MIDRAQPAQPKQLGQPVGIDLIALVALAGHPSPITDDHAQGPMLASPDHNGWSARQLAGYYLKMLRGRGVKTAIRRSPHPRRLRRS